MDLNIKSLMLGIVLSMAVIFMIFAMIPSFKNSGNVDVITYNSTNISALDTASQTFNCTQNASVLFNVTSSVRDTATLYQQILCAPDPAYTNNITVSLYWNDAFIVTSLLNYCNDSTSNNFTITVPVSVGSNIYNMTLETNQCPANPPLDNLFMPGNATCTNAHEANGECLRYYNQTITTTTDGLTTGENVVLGIIILMLIMIGVFYAAYLL